MKFLKKYSWIWLILLGIWLTIELFYRCIPNNYSEKSDRISVIKDSIQVLISGNSHALYGLNPDYFEMPTYNLSQVSQTLYFEELVLQKHLPDFKNVHSLILNISYFTLSQKDFTAEDVFRRYYYHAFMDITDSEMTPWDPKRYSLALTREWKHTWRFMKQAIKKGTLVNCNLNGFGNDYIGQNITLTDESIQHLGLRHEDGLLDFSINLERLKNISELCKSQNTQLILVSLPVSPRYYQQMNIQKWQLIHEQLEAFASTSGTIYFNLLQFDGVEEEDFYDPDHLNQQGAKKISTWLNSKLP
ncbi:MAG: hypothetical protein ACK4RM_06385 [Flavobacterium sp.]